MTVIFPFLHAGLANESRGPHSYLAQGAVSDKVRLIRPGAGHITTAALRFSADTVGHYDVPVRTRAILLRVIGKGKGKGQCVIRIMRDLPIMGVGNKSGINPTMLTATQPCRDCISHQRTLYLAQSKSFGRKVSMPSGHAGKAKSGQSNMVVSAPDARLPQPVSTRFSWDDIPGTIIRTPCRGKQEPPGRNRCR
jgi:hypothetical protein